MTASAWSELETAAFDMLVCRCASLARFRSDSRLAPAVALVALSHVRIDAELRANRVEAELRVDPLPPSDNPAAELIDHFARVVSAACRARHRILLDIPARLDEEGLPLLVADLVDAGASESELTRMAECIGGALTIVRTRVEEVSAQHLQAVLRRDAPQAAFLSCGLTSHAEWLLALHLSGDASRAEVMFRRTQAFALFGSLGSALLEPAIAEIVDRGEPLAPALAAAFDFTEAELSAFRGARDMRASIDQWNDFAPVARRLRAYSVPRHEWPGGGKPESPDAWLNSPWLGTQRTHLIRPDYFDEKETAVQDAIRALKDDLLRPLAAARMPALALRNHATTNFTADLEFPRSLHRGADYRAFLAGLHRAIVGPRKPKAFREAVALWHRRAASVSALRHEHSAERPGWPALCPPWRSEDGLYEIVALTSASDLVVEGNEMQHCVGGYYEICRSGDSQILSLRHEGRRAATVEIALNGLVDASALKVGQFKAVRNTRPADHLHAALREFLRDLRSQAHPINAAKIARYRRRMRKNGDYGWRWEALPLAHAREAYPLYRALLPRSAPESFDDWSVESGLVDTIDRAFAALVEKPAVSTR